MPVLLVSQPEESSFTHESIRHWLPCSLRGLVASLSASALAAFGGLAPSLESAADHHAARAFGRDATQPAHSALGSQEFQQRWVVLHSIGGNWGRGPTSNAESCADCHAGHGRGQAPASHEALASMVVKLSIPGKDATGGPLPHPHYGEQLQNQGELGLVPAEGDAFIAWSPREQKLADGSTVTLRSPKLSFSNLAFGPLGDETLKSVRIAPPLFGAGLLEAIAESTVLDIARHQRDLGLHGRPNYVWDVEKQRTVLGRFGWKASQPTLRQQIASAYLNDLGVTTRLFSHDNCPPVQSTCRKRPTGRIPEQSDQAFNDLLHFIRALGMPAQRTRNEPLVARGERLFVQAQCAVCHVPAIRIAAPTQNALPGARIIHPYTDLLLHDMGEGLADGRPEFRAGPRDWRTPPLWGIGLGATGQMSLLHDGRARNVTEAVLWHGGEAQPAQESFRALPALDRAALLAFIETL